MRTLLLSTLLMACTPDRAASPDVAPAPVAPQPAPADAPLLGVVAARASAVVSAQVDGRIDQVLAKTGQRVRAGDVIVEIDAKVLADRLSAATAAVDAARAEVDGAGAEVAEAKRQLALERGMFAAEAAAEEMVRLARANVARTVASAARASAALRQAEAGRAAIAAELAHTHIAAPIDGEVSLVKVQVGEVVAPGATIARVFDAANLMIRFQVPRDRRRAIVDGTVVELTVAGADHPLRAHVTSVSSDLEPPLDFAVAEADINDTGAAHDVQIGTLGDVRVVARR